MKLGTREAMEISEVLRTNSSIIDHYNLYLNSCQDQQLRSILDRQQRHTIDTFQRLLQMAQSHGIDTNQMPLPTTINTTMGNQQVTTGTVQYGNQWSAPQYGAEQQQAFTGQAGMQYGTQYSAGTGTSQQSAMQTGTTTGTTMLNDRAIAEGALMFHKHSAETNTTAALESAEPHLRNALTNMSRNCIEMSYEIYNYMSQRGWYQMPNTPQNFISHSTTNQQQYPTQ
ncbi:MAG: spore coat protein [Desulfotomaculaceae bacterium]